MAKETTTKTEPSIGSGGVAAAVATSSSECKRKCNFDATGTSLVASALPGCTRLAHAAFSSSSTRLFSGSESAEGTGAAATPTASPSATASATAGFRHVLARKIRRFFREMEIDREPGTPLATAKANSGIRIISPTEPFLHLLPDELRPCYRSPSRTIQALTLLFTTWMAVAFTTWKRRVPAVSKFLLRSVAYFVIAQVALQETLLRKRLSPSRVTTEALVQRYCLPSTLSRYESITIDPLVLPSATTSTSRTASPPSTADPSESNLDVDSSISLGVHYLRYDNENSNNNSNSSSSTDENPSALPSTAGKQTRTFDAVYFQHGFGASSLSWLPVMPSLAKRLGARVALGHDAVGFGFTDRPRDLRWYTAKQSSRIAHQILKHHSPSAAGAVISGQIGKGNGDGDHNGNGDSDAGSVDETKPSPLPVCLVGHSMGSLSVLRLATALPRETPKLIVLSSPALGLLGRKPPPSAEQTNRTGPLGSALADAFAALVDPIGRALRRAIVRPCARYALRRAIGTPNAWRKGLEAAWGDPSCVTEDSDVLRYSWPSIGAGWEDGILNFAAAQGLPQEDDLDDDALLFQRVLELPRTKVLVVLGARDRVVPTASVKAFLETVRLSSSSSSSSSSQQSDAASASEPIVVEMEGLGHNAFEEDRTAFVQTVEQLVAEHWDTADIA